MLGYQEYSTRRTGVLLTQAVVDVIQYHIHGAEHHSEAEVTRLFRQMVRQN